MGMASLATSLKEVVLQRVTLGADALMQVEHSTNLD